MKTYHCPMRLTVAYIEDELADERFAHWRMRDFGVKLDSPEWLGLVGNGSEGRSLCLAYDLEVCRKL